MRFSLLAAQVATASIGVAVASVIAPRDNAATCKSIASAISSASAVYYPGISHRRSLTPWFITDFCRVL